MLMALLLSAAPVQASRTPEQLVEACEASEETYDACLATGFIVGAYYYCKARCESWEAGLIPTEVWTNEKTPPFDSLSINADE